MQNVSAPMNNALIIKHPLIQDKLTRLRDVNTVAPRFKSILKELSILMAFEITRDLKTSKITVQTPLNLDYQGTRVKQSDILLVPILRAGIGMVDGFLEVIPEARVGHIGIYREPSTLKAINYYHKLPADTSNNQMTILLDPMLATGHTMVETLNICLKEGLKNIYIMCLLLAPEGIEEVRNYYPDIPIYTAAIDEKLNEHGYIIPGLGDAGDRIFGTK